MAGNKGMTAVEIIIALALWSIIITLLFTIFSFIARAYENNTNGMDAQYNARMIIFNINKDIRSAKQIEVIGDEKIIITGEDTSVSYYQENGTAYRHGKTKIPIAEKVVDLSFSRQDNLITCSVTTGLVNYEYNVEMSCSPRAVIP